MHPLSNYHTGQSFYVAGLRVTIEYSGKVVDRRVRDSLCVALIYKKFRFVCSEVQVWISSDYIHITGFEGLICFH